MGCARPFTSIQRAQDNCAHILQDIRRAAILAYAPSTMGIDEAQAWAHSAPQDRVLRAIREHDVWIALNEDKPVGWIEVAKDRIAGAYVDPVRTRQGIGSALLAHAEKRIRDAGFTRVSLDASSSAEAFYRSQGYAVLSGVASEPYAVPMTKILSEP